MERTDRLELNIDPKKFVWEEIDKIAVPFLIRSNDEKFSEVNMLLKTLYKKHMELFDVNIFYTVCPMVQEIEPYEIDILNQINQEYSENCFNDGDYDTSSYFLLEKTEAIKLYELFEAFYKMIRTGGIDPKLCGYLKFEGSNTPIPYAVSEKYGTVVPVFMFSILESDNIEFEKTADFWSLSYIELCCKLLSIKLPKKMENNCRTIKIIELSKLIEYDPTLKFNYYQRIPNSVNNIIEFLDKHRSPSNLDNLRRGWIQKQKDLITLKKQKDRLVKVHDIDRGYTTHNDESDALLTEEQKEHSTDANQSFGILCNRDYARVDQEHVTYHDEIDLVDDLSAKSSKKTTSKTDRPSPNKILDKKSDAMLRQSSKRLIAKMLCESTSPTNVIDLTQSDGSDPNGHSENNHLQIAQPNSSNAEQKLNLKLKQIDQHHSTNARSIKEVVSAYMKQTITKDSNFSSTKKKICSSNKPGDSNLANINEVTNVSTLIVRDDSTERLYKVIYKVVKPTKRQLNNIKLATLSSRSKEVKKNNILTLPSTLTKNFELPQKFKSKHKLVKASYKLAPKSSGIKTKLVDRPFATTNYKTTINRKKNSVTVRDNNVVSNLSSASPNDVKIIEPSSNNTSIEQATYVDLTQAEALPLLEDSGHVSKLSDDVTVVDGTYKYIQDTLELLTSSNIKPGIILKQHETQLTNVTEAAVDSTLCSAAKASERTLVEQCQYLKVRPLKELEEKSMNVDQDDIFDIGMDENYQESDVILSDLTSKLYRQKTGKQPFSKYPSIKDSSRNSYKVARKMIKNSNNTLRPVFTKRNEQPVKTYSRKYKIQPKPDSLDNSFEKRKLNETSSFEQTFASFLGNFETSRIK